MKLRHAIHQARSAHCTPRKRELYRKQLPEWRVLLFYAAAFPLLRARCRRFQQDRVQRERGAITHPPARPHVAIGATRLHVLHETDFRHEVQKLQDITCHLGAIQAVEYLDTLLVASPADRAPAIKFVRDRIQATLDEYSRLARRTS